MTDGPLSDMDVYDLLHEARLLLMNKTVQTTRAQDVLNMALRDLAIMQAALLAMMDGVNLSQPDSEA